jgi:DNA-binding MurR/RpiR family transcriptional regulator
MPSTVAQLAAAHHEALTPAERKVAAVVVAKPEMVAFGTVAQIARTAGASGASVVRLATKLGFDGFTQLQDEVQGELSRRLRPATERIRERGDRDLVGRAMRAGLDAVHDTLSGVDGETFEAAVRLLADRARRVLVISGDAGSGVAVMAADQLSMLRRDVVHLDGNPVALARTLADLGIQDVVLALDLRRYDAWVVDVVERAAGHGAAVVALSDSPVSPLARLATHSFVVAAEGAGPFDTYLGAMSLVEVLVTGVARRLRSSATRSLDRLEAAWQEGRLLTD